jgi:hypothetical protein
MLACIHAKTGETKPTLVPVRATGLGEFSPIGQLFKLGIFYYIHNLPTFLGRKSLFRNFDKKVFGYILGDFFKNSSGHPDASVDKKSLDAFCKRIIGN